MFLLDFISKFLKNFMPKNIDPNTSLQKKNSIFAKK